MVHLDNTLDWGMVCYTDGGANPNPGPSGYGVHAYFYTIGKEPAKLKPVKYERDDVVKFAIPTETGYKYCDRSGAISMSRDKQCVLVHTEYIAELAGSSHKFQTNNYAELYAFLQALELATLHGIKKVHFACDSQYVLEGVTQRCKNWASNGWITQQGTPVANQELWKVIWAKVCALREQGVKFSASWIKGHADIPGNIEADNLATIGTLKSGSEIDDVVFKYYTLKEYYEPKKDRHPLMSLKRIYFNREAERNTPGVYFMADPGKDDQLIGKPLPEAVYAVVQLNEPHPVIQAIWKRQARYGQEFNEMMSINVDSVFVDQAYRLAMDHGEFAFKKAPRGYNVEFVDSRPASIERKPIGITMRAIDSLNILDGILSRIKESLLSDQVFESNEIDGLQTHDVTDKFYDYEEKKVGKEIVIKTVFKKDYPVGFRDFKLTLDVKFSDKTRSVTFPLQMGADLPARNSLKQLETDRPRIYLITWRDSELSVRYASAIKCDSGVAIWSNFYADRLVVGK